MSFRIVGIGELLWDLLPGGKKLGGAPGNFIYHASALGAEARLISRVGDDDLGREAVAALQKLGMKTECIETDPKLPTGTVGVELTADGQAKYTIHENVAWDAVSGMEAYQTLAQADAVCFGTLAQRYAPARNFIGLALHTAKHARFRILDINLRAPFYSPEIVEDSLRLANGLKLNETELPYLGTLFGLIGDERAQISQLAERFHLKVVAYTRGERGSLLWHDGEWSELPGTSVQVVDTVGAGDSFTAAMTLGLLAGWPLEIVHQRASAVAAYVCTQAGATPPLPEYLAAPFLAINEKEKP